MDWELHKIVERSMEGGLPPRIGDLLRAEMNPASADDKVMQYLEMYPECREILRAILGESTEHSRER